MLIKTGLIGIGAATILTAGVLTWGATSSYVRTGLRTAGEAAHDMVPTDFEIERIQTLIGDLDSVIVEQESRLIEQQLDLEYLQADVERCQQELDHLTAEVGEARKVLHVHRASYVIGGNAYDRATVVREATGKAERLVRAREITTAKEQTMHALAQALRQAEGQLGEARKQRETYRMRLAELSAKAENVEIRKQLAVSLDGLPTAIDDGAFQEVENAFTRVEKELAVQSRILDERYQRLPETEAISFTTPTEGDVLAVLDAALTGPQPVEALPAPVAEPTADTAVASNEPLFVPATVE